MPDSAPEERPDSSSVRLVDIDAFDAVTLTRTGPYWKLSGPLSRLRDVMADARIDQSGAPVGIFYDDPDTTPAKETRYTLAYPVEPETAELAREALSGGRLSTIEDEQVDVRHFAATTCAALEYEGMGKESGAAYAAVNEWIAEGDMEPSGPPREVYLAEPGTLHDGMIHVLIQQPVVPSE